MIWYDIILTQYLLLIFIFIILIDIDCNISHFSHLKIVWYFIFAFHGFKEMQEEKHIDKLLW